MENARNAHLAVFVLIPVMFGILYGKVNLPLLSLWLVLALALAGFRLWMLGRYPGLTQDAPQNARHEFMRRYGFTWPLSAMLWGVSTWLYFDRAPMAEQFLCWLIMVGLAAFAVTGFSAHLRTMRSYINALALSGAAAIAARLLLDVGLDQPVFRYWLLLLLLLYWHLLLQSGVRLHQTYRASFELQYRNRHLIESLTRQSQAAADALAIKNRFLAGAAHDIRQPVHALALYAELLASEPHMVDEIAPKIVKSTKAVNALFDSLFDLVRLDSGKLRISIETIDLSKFLRDLELQYRPLAEAKGLEFRVRVRAGELRSDPILLQRIVGNLLDNAVKYTARGGVLLAARHAKEGVRIEVWDTGIGIAPEHQQDVFQEFYKVSAHAGTDEGFGLGLAIVARLTAVLGHSLKMQSQVGRGTRFRLDLRASDTQGCEARALTVVAQLVSKP